MNTVFLRRTFLVLCLLAVAAVTTAANSATQAKLVSDFGGGRIRAMAPLNGGLWLAVCKEWPQEGEVWFSDGTAAGTVFVKSIPNTRTAWPDWQGISTWTIGNTVFFSVEHGDGWDEPPDAIWRSDGTAEGTNLITEDPYGMEFLGVANGSLCFCLLDNRQILRTDGTVPGTYPLNTDMWGWDGQVLNNVVYFIGEDEEHGRELWRTDGTVDGTYIVKDLLPGEENGASDMAFALNNVLYFVGHDAEGNGLFRTDGTEQGTTIVKHFQGIATEFCPPAILGDYAVFYADDGVHGMELWRSDGSPEGTTMIKDMGLGSERTGLHVAGDNAYFFMYGLEGYQLWKTNGTEEGTTQIEYGTPETDTYNMPQIMGVDNHVYFSFWKLGTGLGPIHFFRSNGTTEGTVLLAELEGFCIEEVWRYNGTVYFSKDGSLGIVNETTAELVELEDVALGVTQGAASRLYRSPVAMGDQLYLAGGEGGLWAVNPAFRFTRMPYSGWRGAGDPLVLTVECEGGIGALSYQWMLDGEEIDGATEPNYTVDSVTEDHEGWYSCRVSDETDTLYETEPVFVEVFEEGSLPAAGPLALFALAAAYTIGAARAIKRRKN